MHESWPAWGGSTSVGTGPRAREVEKSRNRATGVSKMILWGVVQDGGRRDQVISSHRGTSSASILPVKAPPIQSVRPFWVATQPSSQLASSGEDKTGNATGGYCGTAIMTASLKTKSTDGSHRRSYSLLDPFRERRAAYLSRVRAAVVYEVETSLAKSA